VDAPLSVSARYTEALDRLEAGFLDRGWVISRERDGTPTHTGDSLIWSGMLLAAVPCDRGVKTEAALIEMITDLGGALVRYIPTVGKVRGASLDGALGLYRGIAHRIKCPGKADLWREAVRLHSEYVRTKRDLHPTGATVPPGFTYVLERLARELGAGGSPDSDDLGLLRPALAVWAKSTVDMRKPCYRVHLGLLVHQALDDLGVSPQHEHFCIAAKGGGMPLVDHFCGQPEPLLTWIEKFEYDRAEYFLQRCSFESEHTDGVLTPGLDLIVAIRTAYAL